MGYAPALRWLTVVRDREAQFTCVGMGHTASIRYILVLATLPVEAFRTFASLFLNDFEEQTSASIEAV